jgi:hypothetical protein
LRHLELFTAVAGVALVPTLRKKHRLPLAASQAQMVDG